MIHVCHDRFLHRDRARPHRVVGDRAISPINKQWPNGRVLTVAFMGGTDAQRALVVQHAPKWSQHANLQLAFKDSLPADIRISFDPGDGAWSYVGTDNAEIPANQPTLNLGWQDQAVILHEVGHTLGLSHEHQNPSGGIKWNEAAVIADLSGPPNWWDEETIRHNVLRKYAANQIIGTDFDPASIMLYSFPASWTTDGFSAPWNQAISAQDGAFVGSAKMYPKAAVELPLLALCRAHGAQIAARGELDEYRFTAPVSGQYVFETAAGPDGAAVDTVLALWQGTKLVAQDDDSGRGLFSRIEAKLAAGEYRVTVKHSNASGTGKYRLIAWG